MAFLKGLLNIILYGNIYIAICALALSVQTFLLLEQRPDFFLLLLIFSATLSLYSIHRLVGLGKISSDAYDMRFRTIYRLKAFLKIFSVLGLIAAAVCYFFISDRSKLLLLLLALPSLGYVIPLIQGKRLRDFSYLKIFLISAVWALVTVILPIIESSSGFDLKSMLLLAERAIFVFAITIPFDIRDIEIEKTLKVSTLPSRIGVKNSIRLSVALLFVWLIPVHVIYPLWAALMADVVAIITMFLVSRSAKIKNDLFYTAFLDGTMLLQGILVSMAILLSSK